MSSSAQAATLDQLRAAVSQIDERHAEGESEFFAPLTGPNDQSSKSDETLSESDETPSESNDRPSRAKTKPRRSRSKASARASNGGAGWPAFDTGEPPPFAVDYSDSDDSDSDAPDFDESYAKAKKTAMNMLAMRDHASQELREKLIKRDFLPEAVDELIAKLQKSKLLNDEEFAHRYVRAHRERRKLSQSVLRRELNKKGIPAEIISDAVDEVDGEEDLAREVAAKKAASTSRLAYEVRERRILGMLARRGFSSSICIKVTREVLAED